MGLFSRSPSWGIDLPELYFDGATPVEKNIGGHGWVIYENEQVVRRGYGVFRRSRGDLTSHYSEFVAVVKGLQTMLDLGYDQVRVKGDNIHVLGSLNSASNWDDPQIQLGADLARRLFHSFPSIKEAQKIHRAENSEADSLARDALNVYRDSTQRAESDPILAQMSPASSGPSKPQNPVHSIV